MDILFLSELNIKKLPRMKKIIFQKLYGFMKHCLQFTGIYLSTWHFHFYKLYYTAVEPKELERVYLNYMI